MEIKNKPDISLLDPTTLSSLDLLDFKKINNIYILLPFLDVTIHVFFRNRQSIYLRSLHENLFQIAKIFPSEHSEIREAIIDIEQNLNVISSWAIPWIKPLLRNYNIRVLTTKTENVEIYAENGISATQVNIK